MSTVGNKILITGAAGKVGQAFLWRLLADSNFSKTSVRALCHNRQLDGSDRLEVVTGDLSKPSKPFWL